MNPFQTTCRSLSLLGLLLISTSILHAQCPEHKALLDKMDQAMAEKNPELLKDVYHADAVRHTQEGKEEGIDALMAGAKEFYQNVPDAKGENLDIICAGDKIVTRWKGTGTPQGAPKPIQVTGITIMQVKDGKVIEEWEELNAMSMMMQMGFTLTPPGEGGK